MNTSNDITDTIAVMQMQEETAYVCADYLKHAPENKSHVDIECRTKMTEWCFQVVDFCECDRESVGIAMSYLDRFLCTHLGNAALEDRKQFQLAAMCCLYTAIKLFETREMNLSLLADLSRGCYSEADIANMEIIVLSALQWRMHPPTSINFVHQFHMLLSPTKIGADFASALKDISRIQTVLAIKEYSLVTCKPSVVAIAAMMNALDMVDSACHKSMKSSYISNIVDTLPTDQSELNHVRFTLRNCLDNSSTSEKNDLQAAILSATKTYTSHKIHRSTSPVCVSRKSQRNICEQ